MLLTGCLSTNSIDPQVPEEVKAAFREPLTSEGIDHALCLLPGMFPQKSSSIDFSFDTNCVDVLIQDYGAERYTVRWTFHDLEARYAFSWFLHILDASANIRPVSRQDRETRLAEWSDKTQPPTADPRKYIVWITAGPTKRHNDPFFNCYRDRSGDWYREVTRRLDEMYEARTDRQSVNDLILDLGKTKGLSFIIDPAIPLESTHEQRLQLSQERQSVRETLSYALNQVSIGFRPQGGVIFLFGKSKRMPNKASEATR